MTHSADTSWHGRWWDLPPLILHPFGRGLEASASFDSIKLALYLGGMGETGLRKEPLLRARYADLRQFRQPERDLSPGAPQWENSGARHKPRRMPESGHRVSQTSRSTARRQ